MVAALRRLRMTGAEIAMCLRMALSTVSAVLKRIGLGKLSRLDLPEPPNRYERRQAGELLHIDIKKLGRIPTGGGHRVHGRGPGRHHGKGLGWDYVHVCVDDATRLAYVEVLPNEQATTVTGFLSRAVGFYRRHGIRDDRQRRRLPLHPSRPHLPRSGDPAPPDPALPAAHERQSRALHPHSAR